MRSSEPGDAPSETILTTSSLLTAFNMNKALNRSCKGVVPDVLSRVALSESICAGVTCTDIVCRCRVDEEERERDREGEIKSAIKR